MYIIRVTGVEFYVRSFTSALCMGAFLFTVVNHHGARLLGGHYTTYVYHMGINGWIHIDDEIVRTVRVESMLKHNPPRVPYLLYYRKVDQ